MALDWTAAARALEAQGSVDAARGALIAAGLVHTSEPGGAGRSAPRWSGSGACGGFSVATLGGRWFDFVSEKGGRGPISLIRHMTGVSAPEAAQLMTRHAHDCAASRALREAAEIAEGTAPGRPADPGRPLSL